VSKECCICEKLHSGHGHNPTPIGKQGQCCDVCHGLVIKARLNCARWERIFLENFYQTNSINLLVKKSKSFRKEILAMIGKYKVMDWGDTCKADSIQNDNAVYFGNDRIVAKYITSKGDVFIITEWDRSATTILFAHEN